jgi:hypothetical protein
MTLTHGYGFSEMMTSRMIFPWVFASVKPPANKLKLCRRNLIYG